MNTSISFLQQVIAWSGPTLLLAIAIALATFPPGISKANNGDYRVTIQNISPAIITPPAVALTRNDISYFEVGESASEAVELVAEGGDTGELASVLQGLGASVAAASDPLAPGESVELHLDGRRGYFHLAAMLLPTNDAFAAIDAERLRGRTQTFYARSYDAGTEANSEDTSDIPGPFGGEGYNEERDDVDFIHPHPGLHGEGNIDHAVYNWDDPVLKVTVERI